MGAEQLIGTIEQVEQHEHDPTSNDPWSEASEQWAGLGEGLRRRYHDLVGDGGPSEEDIKDAFRTLGDAARSVVDSIGSALRDPEVRTQVKEAAVSLVSALGTTFDELGDELRRTFREEEDRDGSDGVSDPSEEE